MAPRPISTRTLRGGLPAVRQRATTTSLRAASIRHRPRAPRRLSRRDDPGDPHVTNAIRTSYAKAMTNSTSYCAKSAAPSATSKVAVLRGDPSVGQRSATPARAHIHLTLMPFIGAGELKTKPTDSVKECVRSAYSPTSFFAGQTVRFRKASGEARPFAMCAERGNERVTSTTSMPYPKPIQPKALMPKC